MPTGYFPPSPVLSKLEEVPGDQPPTHGADTRRTGALVSTYLVPRDERPHDWESTRRWLAADGRTWGGRIASPLGALTIAALLVVALSGYGLGTSLRGTAPSGSTGSPSAASMTSTMNMGSAASTAPANVPDATQDSGNQLAQFVVDPDGAKHFTFTAKQVMWQPVKGQRVLAWTLDGTVPGPMIRVTAGDHVRITINNRLPEPTTIHWHGLEIPATQDGVPGVGQKPIQPNQSYTYDFTIQDQDAGTHFYHSHYDDMRQVSGGLYGAFIVDPRPGTPQAQQAIHADVEYTEIINEMSGYYVINGKSFPDTQPMLVKHGQTVHVRLINLGELVHPMHLHGHFFTVLATDGRPIAQPYQKDTLSIAPGEDYDFTFNAWAAPGSVYPFHCHILAHVMNPGQTHDEMGGLIVLVKYAA